LPLLNSLCTYRTVGATFALVEQPFHIQTRAGKKTPFKAFSIGTVYYRLFSQLNVSGHFWGTLF
jgi:hypothetical protein